MKTAIVTDTNSGITVKNGKKSGIYVLSMPVIIEETGILHIKPILTIQGEKLDLFSKVRGSRQCEKKMIQAIKNDIADRFSQIPSDRLRIGTAGTFEKKRGRRPLAESGSVSFSAILCLLYSSFLQYCLSCRDKCRRYRSICHRKPQHPTVMILSVYKFRSIYHFQITFA